MYVAENAAPNAQLDIDWLAPGSLLIEYEMCPSESQNTALPRRRVLIARGLAAAADALQIVLFPLFGEGFASPADWILDGVMALALTKLVGFHWSYLPGTALELIPGADLAPSWTAAAWLATRDAGGPASRQRWFVTVLIALALAAAIVGWFLWVRHR